MEEQPSPFPLSLSYMEFYPYTDSVQKEPSNTIILKGILLLLIILLNHLFLLSLSLKEIQRETP